MIASKEVSAFCAQSDDFLQDCHLKYILNKWWAQLHTLEESFVVGVSGFLWLLTCFCFVAG